MGALVIPPPPPTPLVPSKPVVVVGVIDWREHQARHLFDFDALFSPCLHERKVQGHRKRYHFIGRIEFRPFEAFDMLPGALGIQL